MTLGNLEHSVIGIAVQDGLARGAGNTNEPLATLTPEEVVQNLKFSESGRVAFNVPLAIDSMATGSIDEATRLKPGLQLTGWTYVPESAGRPEFVIAVENGKVVGALAITVRRPDVAKALNTPKALRTGYSGVINTNPNIESCRLTLYTLTSSLKLFAMPSVCEKASHSTQ